ncbi:MAG: GNAT family N-acetyltransferase [Candidatus Pacebacteria bacterium]|nr:GNAT family N-acetyltransferase [Candidatus Paceibacterota bacterium]
MKETQEFLNMDDLREALEYFSGFRGKRFCVVIDAESFDEYDCMQLAHDFLQISYNCQIELTIVVGCFPLRVSAKKQRDLLGKILSAQRSLQESIEQLVVADIKGGSAASHFFKTEEDASRVEERPIVILPAVRPGKGGNVISSIAETLAQKEFKQAPFSKLIIISGSDGIFVEEKTFLPQITADEALQLVKDGKVSLQVAEIVKTAVSAMDALGVKRAQLVNGKEHNALIVELFTKKGFGTMIYRGNYQDARPAINADVVGIHSIVLHYADRGIISLHSLDEITANLKDFVVVTVDGHVVAASRLRIFPSESKACISSFVVHPSYVKQGVAKKLLAGITSLTDGKAGTITLVDSNTPTWWLSQEFDKGNCSQLPEAVKKELAQRGVPKTILVKKLS